MELQIHTQLSVVSAKHYNLKGPGFYTNPKQNKTQVVLVQSGKNWEEPGKYWSGNNLPRQALKKPIDKMEVEGLSDQFSSGFAEVNIEQSL